MKKKKRVEKVSKKKDIKYKKIDINKLKKIEVILSVVVGVVFLILLGFAVTNQIFIPATLIAFALFLFCICYYYIDDESKKKLVYVLFSIGTALIIAEVVYILVKII